MTMGHARSLSRKLALRRSAKKLIPKVDRIHLVSCHSNACRFSRDATTFQGVDPGDKTLPVNDLPVLAYSIVRCAARPVYRALLLSSNKMPTQAKNADVLRTREKIKQELPRLYDLFWRECDSGKYFFVPLRKLPRKTFRPRNELLLSGSTTIRLSYGDFIEHSAMALAANTLADTLPDDAFANHFRFNVRNRDVATALRSFFRFLDQTTFHLYELSDRALLPKKVSPRRVDFGQLEKHLVNGLPNPSGKIANAAKAFLEAARLNLPEVAWKLLRDFRNADTHRYVVGIDHISYGFSRDDGGVRLNSNGRLMTLGDTNSKSKSYSWYGRPDIDFATVERILRACMNNAKAIMFDLCHRRLLASET